MTPRRRRVPEADDTSEISDASNRSDVERPSRTQRTRAAAAVNALGLELTRLSARELDRLELPERIREEVELSQRLKPRDRGRQNRLIGQLLRAEDHEAIERRLNALEQDRRDGVRHERVSEAWVERLVEEGDPAIEALIAEHPEADRQSLRRRVRHARGTSDVSKAKRARRELLRAIRALRA